MSRSLGCALPDELLERLASETLGPWHDAVVPIATVDRLARPHAALLSYDELAARDAGSLRLATYEDSHTSDNLRLRGALTLYLFAPGTVHYVKALAHEVAGGVPGHPGLAQFEARVEDVLVDELDPSREDAARLRDAPRFERAHPPLGLRAVLLSA